MQIVIDTNILYKAAHDFSQDHMAVMTFTVYLKHQLVLDHKGDLLKEYREEVGKYGLFQKWYKELQNKRLIHYCNGVLSSRIAQTLTELGLHEPEDHVVVALALNSGKYIVTEDSDFGKGDLARAAEHEVVREHLTNDLGLLLHDATEACEQLATMR